MEAESAESRADRFGKPFSSGGRAFGALALRRSCADLVELLDDAYGSFLGRENATTSC